MDETTVADLNGTTVMYGYQPEYLGHSSVLMHESDMGTYTGWAPATYAIWDEASMTLLYDWPEGVINFADPANTSTASLEVSTHVVEVQ
jgi:hypothetical protein